MIELIFMFSIKVCPLWIGSYSYSVDEVVYKWKIKQDNPHWKPIQIDDGVKLSQFDLLGTNWNKTDFYQNSKLFNYLTLTIHQIKCF